MPEEVNAYQLEGNYFCPVTKKQGQKLSFKKEIWEILTFIRYEDDGIKDSGNLSWC